jgi:transposase-like protein
VCDAVAPSSIVHTDGWGGYNKLAALGYSHEVPDMSSSDDPAHVSMPGVHRITSLLKRRIPSIHQGSVVQRHLQSYLEEFTFRFNRHTSRSRGFVFRRLLEQAVATSPTTESDIIGGYDWGLEPDAD